MELCYIMVNRFEWQYNARPVVSGILIDKNDIIGLRTRIRVRNVSPQGDLVVFEGILTSKVSKPLQNGFKIYEFEASDYLYLAKYLQIVVDYYNEVSLSTVLQDLFDQFNRNILYNMGVSLDYYARDIERDIYVSGKFIGSFFDILDFIQNEFGIYYWIININDRLKIIPIKSNMISKYNADMINLKILGINGNNILTDDINGLLKDIGDRQGKKGSVVILRSKTEFKQLGPYEIKFDEDICEIQDGRLEPCIVIDDYGFDLWKGLEVIFAIKQNNEYIPVSVLTKRGEKRDGKWIEDVRYDYTVDIDYWNRNNGKLRIFIRDEYSIGYAYIRGMVYKEIILNPPMAIRIIELRDYDSVDGYLFNDKLHGQIIYLDRNTGDSYIDSLLFVSENEKESKVLLINMRGEIILNENDGSGFNFMGIVPGVVHPNLGKVKQLRYNGGIMECEFSPEMKISMEELVLKLKKELHGLKMRFAG